MAHLCLLPERSCFSLKQPGSVAAVVAAEACIDESSTHNQNMDSQNSTGIIPIYIVINTMVYINTRAASEPENVP